LSADILTVQEVAKMLGLSEVTIYRLAKKGEIPARKVGRSWRFSRSAIERWIRKESASWEEELEGLLKDMQAFAREKRITEEDIEEAVAEVRTKKRA
jgi:excisionase family DNA binding protein